MLIHLARFDNVVEIGNFSCSINLTVNTSISEKCDYNFSITL